MRVKIITAYSGSGGPSLGDMLTKETEEWIEANRNEIYSISSIKTKLSKGHYGMVTIVYSKRGHLV